MMKNQLHRSFKDCNISKLSIDLYGTPASNPTSQKAGTLFLRIFAQARRKEDIAAPKSEQGVRAPHAELPRYGSEITVASF
jgi:hypothetical protein